MTTLILASLIGTACGTICDTLDPFGVAKSRREGDASLKRYEDSIQGAKDHDKRAAERDKRLVEMHDEINRMLKSAGLPSLEERERKKNDKP